MSNSKGDIIEKTIKTILSCRTQKQLDVAFTYSRLAKKQYLNMIDSKTAAGQFGLDMLVLIYVRMLELRNAKQNPTNN